MAELESSTTTPVEVIEPESLDDNVKTVVVNRPHSKLIAEFLQDYDIALKTPDEEEKLAAEVATVKDIPLVYRLLSEHNFDFSYNDSYLLKAACKYKSVRSATYLVREKKVPIVPMALELAALSGSYEMCVFLLKYNATMTDRTLSCAIQSGELRVVKLCVLNRASVLQQHVQQAWTTGNGEISGYLQKTSGFRPVVDQLQQSAAGSSGADQKSQ